MADVFTALTGAIANCIGPENCQKCEYRDVRMKTRCKTMLLRDALELLKAQEPEDIRPGRRFRLSTGDWFVVKRVEGPHCEVVQERTGYELLYGLDALRRLPITWEGEA